jgi:TRAP-type uncharacterized transport system substrate-binding protein
MFMEKIAGHPYRSWGLAALTVLAFGLSAVALVRWQRTRAPLRLRVSSGIAGGERSETLVKMVVIAAQQGVTLVPLRTTGSPEAIALVNSGDLDLATVQGGIDFSSYPNIRQVTSLQVLPLHLLVKEEIGDEVTTHLGALRGKVVNLGAGEGSGTYVLAREVLAFAGLRPGAPGQPGDYQATALTGPQLAAQKDRARLPDAIFVVAPLPTPFVRSLVEQHYRLIPLLFRDAFALEALADPLPVPQELHHSPGEHPGPSTRQQSQGPSGHPVILREHVIDTVIPAFTYRADPGTPSAPLHTLGTKALMIANRHVESEAVCRVLEFLFGTRYAKISQPPLDVHRLEEVPGIPWHAGAVAYLERSKPIFTGEFVTQLINLLSIAGPVCGGALFLWQWFRQRSRLRSEQSFEAYLDKVSVLEQAALRREHDSPLDTAEAARLWDELGRLKAEAVGKFARGEIEGEAMLTSFLTHVNDARAHLGHLIDRAQRQGGPGRSSDPVLRP